MNSYTVNDSETVFIDIESERIIGGTKRVTRTYSDKERKNLISENEEFLPEGWEKQMAEKFFNANHN